MHRMVHMLRMLSMLRKGEALRHVTAPESVELLGLAGFFGRQVRTKQRRFAAVGGTSCAACAVHFCAYAFRLCKLPNGRTRLQENSNGRSAIKYLFPGAAGHHCCPGK